MSRVIHENCYICHRQLEGFEMRIGVCLDCVRKTDGQYAMTTVPRPRYANGRRKNN